MMIDEFVKLNLGKTKTAQKTNQIIVVVKDRIYLYNKKDEKWEKVMQADCIYGKNGYSLNRHEGDFTTPIGSFKLLYAFGTEETPNTQMKYRKILDTSYYSQDKNKKDEYNRWIESKSKIDGEHLIDYSKQYHYAIVIGFNIDPVIVGKGSSIFLHVKGEKSYTEGCIAVDENIMKDIFSKIRDGSYIIMVDDFSEIINY